MFPNDIRILVVDDMPSIRDLVRTSLKKLGFENIFEAQDGQHALDLLNSYHKDGKPFNLVLADWNMPRMMGIDLLKNVRKNPHWEFLPFILITTESEKAQILEAIASGVSDYVVKPFSVAVLQNKIAAVYKRWTEKI